MSLSTLQLQQSSSRSDFIFKLLLYSSLQHRCREFINPIGSNLIPDNKGMRFNPCHIALPGCRPGPGACTKSGRSLGEGSPDLSSAAVVPCVFGDHFQVLFSPALKLPKHKKLRQQMAMNTNLLYMHLSRSDTKNILLRVYRVRLAHLIFQGKHR